MLRIQETRWLFIKSDSIKGIVPVKNVRIKLMLNIDLTDDTKEREYKHKKRHLEKWDQIYFNSEIWEVQSYSMKKWYIVKSIVTWEEKRISTSDNHYRRNNHCVRFVKLENPVVLMRTKEKPQFEVKTDGETFELTPPPKEEKKFSIDLDEMLYWEYE